MALLNRYFCFVVRQYFSVALQKKERQSPEATGLISKIGAETPLFAIGGA